MPDILQITAHDNSNRSPLGIIFQLKNVEVLLVHDPNQ